MSAACRAPPIFACSATAPTSPLHADHLLVSSHYPHQGAAGQAGSGAVSVVEHKTPPPPGQDRVRLKGLLVGGAENVPLTKLTPLLSVVGPKEAMTNPVVLELAVRVQLAAPLRVTEARKE